MFAPVVSFIEHELSILDEPLRVLVRTVVQFDCHRWSSSYAELGLVPTSMIRSARVRPRHPAEVKRRGPLTAGERSSPPKRFIGHLDEVCAEAKAGGFTRPRPGGRQMWSSSSLRWDGEVTDG
jgi:hypothetical protein